MSRTTGEKQNKRLYLRRVGNDEMMRVDDLFYDAEVGGKGGATVGNKGMGVFLGPGP